MWRGEGGTEIYYVPLRLLLTLQSATVPNTLVEKKLPTSFLCPSAVGITPEMSRAGDNGLGFVLDFCKSLHMPLYWEVCIFLRLYCLSPKLAIINSQLDLGESPDDALYSQAFNVVSGICLATVTP